MQKPAQHGMTMIELVSAVVVVGIVATAAAVSYSNSLEESHKKEAKYVLSLIRNAELRYFADTGTFADNWNDLDIDLPTSPYFTYEVASLGPNDFMGAAFRPLGYAAGYTLQITRSGAIEEVPMAVAGDPDGPPGQSPPITIEETGPVETGPVEGGPLVGEAPPTEIISVNAGSEPQSPAGRVIRSR